MSKLAIVFCAVLFASAAHGFFFTSALQSAQNKAEQMVSRAIYEVESRIESSQNAVQEMAVNLMNEAMKLSDQVQGEIKNILNEAEKEINKYSGTIAIGIDVAGCSKTLSDLDKSGLAVMSDMSVCITEKLEAGSGYVESIYAISRNVQEDLNEISDDLRRCVEKITGLRSTITAISCTRDVATKASWLIPKLVRILTSKISELTYMLGSLKPSLTYCMATNGLKSFYREASIIVEKTKKCIDSKVDKAHNSNATPKPFLPHPESTDKTVTNEVTEKAKETATEKYSIEIVTNKDEIEPHAAAASEHVIVDESTAGHVFVVEKEATTEEILNEGKIIEEEDSYKPHAAETEHVIDNELVDPLQQVA